MHVPGTIYVENVRQESHHLLLNTIPGAKLLDIVLVCSTEAKCTPGVTLDSTPKYRGCLDWSLSGIFEVSAGDDFRKLVS